MQEIQNKYESIKDWQERLSFVIRNPQLSTLENLLSEPEQEIRYEMYHFNKTLITRERYDIETDKHIKASILGFINY